MIVRLSLNDPAASKNSQEPHDMYSLIEGVKRAKPVGKGVICGLTQSKGKVGLDKV